MTIPSFEDYVATLGRLTAHVDPTASSPNAVEIKTAAASLAALPAITLDILRGWIEEHPAAVYILGLAVGLSHEKLKNVLKHHFNTSGWYTLAKTRPEDLLMMMELEYDLIRLLNVQRLRSYDFGDILAARAGTRATATRAGQSGRKVEDEIELIAKDLGLLCAPRTRFIGRAGRDAPCDLAIPSASSAQIVVAAKGFDSTGSKLTDAVREIVEMAEVRRPRQFVMAVIDGIGWKSRAADLRRIYDLWASGQIDGMYTLATLDAFRADLESAARLRGLI
ncbi:hypothetical protein ACFY2Q_10900 [Micromonospora sp. NPDC000316]|uniref:hypothetical protein n=1 Tax=Micromonospora sp. NPDC000316 TaxID=3364216 RepID=UPI0036830EA0